MTTSPTPIPPFSVDVTCLTCASVVEIIDRDLCGAIIACPSCGGMVSVPMLKTATGPPPILEDDHATSKQAPDISPSELRLRRGLVFAFGSLSTILFLLILYALLVAPPPPPNDQLATDNPLNNLPGDLAPDVAVPNLPAPEVVVTEVVAPEIAVPEVVASEVAASEFVERDPIAHEPPSDRLEPIENSHKETLAAHRGRGVVEGEAYKLTRNGSDDATRERLWELMRQTPVSAIPDHNDAVDERLTVPITSLTANAVPAVELARTLAEIAAVSISIAPPLAEEKLSLTLAAPTTVGEALRALAAMQDATIVVEVNQVTWRRLEDEKESAMLERRFDVGDLAHERDLASMITTLIPLKSAELAGLEIVCVGTRRAGDEVERFLETIRVVQQIPQRTSRSPESLATESFGWDAMQQPLVCDIFRPMRLDDFLTRLEEKTSLRFLIDHAALGRGAAPIHTLEGTVSADETTIDGALTAFLKSLGAPVPLTYRICSDRVFEITTDLAARAADRFTLELHRLPNAPLQRAQVLTAVAAITPATHLLWSGGGGDWFFLRASQPDQRTMRHIVAATPATTASTPTTEPATSDNENEIEF